MGVITHVFSGVFSIGELIYFILSSAILVLVNMIGITKIQQSFKVGQASNMMPIQQVPQQISPVLIYLLVFLLIPPNILSIIYLFVGISLILISSFLLGKRQAQIEQI